MSGVTAGSLLSANPFQLGASVSPSEKGDGWLRRICSKQRTGNEMRSAAKMLLLSFPFLRLWLNGGKMF